MFISNSEVRAILKKGYVIIFILGIISLIIGLVLTSLIGFIPSVNYGDPGYEEYHDLILNMNSLSILCLNLGFGLFLLSTFIGAVTDKRFSIEVKKGMLIASVLGVFSLLIFNYFTFYFLIGYS